MSLVRQPTTSLMEPRPPLSSNQVPPPLESSSFLPKETQEEEEENLAQFLSSSEDEAEQAPEEQNGDRGSWQRSNQVSHQKITLDTELGSNNVGFAMLKKMGWGGSGVGLGIDGSGENVYSIPLPPLLFARISGIDSIRMYER